MENDDLPIKSAAQPNPEIEARKTKIIQDKAKRIREQEQRKRQKEQEKKQKAQAAEVARNMRQDRQEADKQRSIDRSASADQKKQERRAGVTTRDAMRKNKSKTTAGKSFFGNRSASNLAINASTEINCIDDMFGLNEDYYRIDHGKVPTTFSSNQFHGHDDDSNEITGVYASHKKHAMGHVYAVPREVPWVFHHNNDGQKNLYIHKDHKDKVENHSATLSKFHKSNGFRGIDGSDEENVSKKNERPHSQTKIDSADHIRKQGIKIHYVDSNKLKQKANQTHTDKGKTFKAAGNENINEDMYFKVKIEGLPTMYVNSANREELRKDLVGLLRNPSKAVGDIKRVTPQEVKKRLRLRSQGKEEEEMNETYIKFDHPKLTYISKGFNDRRGATLHNDQLVGSGKASHKSFVQKHKDDKFYVVDVPAPPSRFKKESSVTRSKISGEMDKASGRTQIDRKNDLAKAKAARKQSTKDLEKFRADNAELLKGSSVDEAKAPNKSKSYIQQLRRQHAELKKQHQQLVRNELGLAEDVMTSTSADSQVKLNPESGKYEKKRMKRGQINAQTATESVMSKLKNYYMKESSAYYDGLSKSTADDRKAHFKKHGKKADDDNSAYKPAPGDATAKTKPSIHTKKAAAMGMGPKNEAGLWANIHAKRARGEKMRKKGAKGAPTPEAIRSAQKESYNINENKKGLENKAEKSGMPLGVLKQVYNRGLAAWKTGHRPGTTPEQWGMARVNSFITKSSGTWGKADKDLAAKVKK